MNSFFSGLDINHAKFLSCTKCSSASEVPYLFAALDGNGKVEGLLEWANKATTVAADLSTGSGGNSVHCYNPDLLSDNLVYTTFTKVTNCAYYIVEVKAASVITCGACKPGYVNTGPADAPTACDLITGCNTSSSSVNILVNKCSECLANSAPYHTYDNNTIEFDKCTAHTGNGTTVANCYAYDINNDECKFCDKGYTLNLRKACEIINPPNCAVNSYKQFNSFSDTVGTGFSTYFFSDGIGCTKCNPGFKPFLR